MVALEVVVWGGRITKNLDTGIGGILLLSDLGVCMGGLCCWLFVLQRYVGNGLCMMEASHSRAVICLAYQRLPLVYRIRENVTCCPITRFVPEKTSWMMSSVSVMDPLHLLVASVHTSVTCPVRPSDTQISSVSFFHPAPRLVTCGDEDEASTGVVCRGLSP